MTHWGGGGGGGGERGERERERRERERERGGERGEGRERERERERETETVNSYSLLCASLTAAAEVEDTFLIYCAWSFPQEFLPGLASTSSRRR